MAANNDERLDERIVDVFMLDVSKRAFEPKLVDHLCWIVRPDGPSDTISYLMEVRSLASDTVPVLSLAVSPALLPSFQDTASSPTAFDLQWVSKIDERVYCYALRVKGSDPRHFQQRFLQCLWEVNAQRPFDAVRPDDRPDVSSCLEPEDADDEPVLCDDDPVDFERVHDDDDDDDEQPATPPRSSVARLRLPATPDESLFRTPDKKRLSVSVPMTAPSHLEQNKLLAVSYNSDRTFVGRGNRVGVFRQSEQDLDFYTALAPLRTVGGEALAPTQMLLHEQDSSMLVVDETRRKSVFKVDLERGAVVQEWSMEDGSGSGGQYPVAALAPASKFAQRTASPLVVGINENSIFTIDGRLPGVQRVEQLTFTYGGASSAKPRMTAMATTQDGHMVVGAADGSIRLFHRNAVSVPRADLLDRVPRAKSLLTAKSLGFGSPIVAIDVTADGRWVLATCATYLLLVPTSVAGGTGFSRAIGKQQPAAAILLRPSRDDVLKLGGVVDFKPARFNVSATSQERSICTASGNYSFAWNFDQVVRHGIRDVYYMKRFDEEVTVSQFTFEDDSKMVVALESDVQLARRTTHVVRPIQF